MRAQVIACENCSKADQGIVPTGGVHNGWLNLVIYSAQIGREEGPVNFIKAPVVVDLCSPACAQAWAVKLFATIFGKGEEKVEEAAPTKDETPAEA